MKYTKIIIVFSFLFLIVISSNAKDMSDYLILQDIGDYKFITQTKDFITGQIKTIPGYTIRSAPGILAGTDHFDIDHDDTTYETDYTNRNIKLGVEVQVTQHAGSDSDKWLLHEVEDAFRKNPEEDNFKGVIREINGNRIFTYRRGTHYSWISNNVVIDIRYTDLRKTKPEPLEIVSAYLQKFPSTMPSTLVPDRAHDEQWIKDEMERRLWLCDKWFLHLQMGKADESETLRTAVKHIVVFLDYREKYYGIKGRDEKVVLSGYLTAKDGTSIKSKLTEYKTWWSVNKTKAINLP